MIREAFSNDAAAIAQVHLQARTAGYAHFMSVTYNASQTFEHYLDEWQERLAESIPRTVVAEDGSEIRGFARFGGARGIKPSPDAGALELLYVLPEFWGTGMAATLLAAAEEGLADQGFMSAFLAVYEQNHRARAFYERQGWTFDGTQWEVDRGGPVTQMRYVKQL